MADGRTYGGETAGVRSARRRRQLLDAGLALFGTLGYRRVTVRQICAEARVSHRGFYAEFPGTEDLLIAVYDESMDRLEQAVVAAAGSDGDIDTTITAAIDAFVTVLGDDHRLARVVWFEVLGVGDRVEDAYLRRTEAFVALLGVLLDQASFRVVLTGVQRTVVLRALVGAVSEVSRRWVKDDFATPKRDLVDPLVALLRAAAAGLRQSDD